MTASYVIGRAEDCDIQVDSEYATNHHARITQDERGLWWVEDLGSTNGTRLIRDGRAYRVTIRQPLRLGDVIEVGRAQIPWQPSAAEPIRVTAEVGQRLDDATRSR